MQTNAKHKILSNKFLKSYVYFLLITFIFLFPYSNIYAQQFTASVDYNQVPLNYTVDLTYTIEGGKASSFTPPKFDGFEVYGPSQGNNISIINGRVSKSTTLTYTLKPNKQGAFVIASATAIISGKEMKSNSVNIQVVAAQERRRSNDPFQSMMDEMEEMQRQMMQQFQQPAYTEEEIKQYLSKNLLVKVTPAKTSIYQGEQTTLSYKIYSRVTCNGIVATKMPSFNGFLSEEFILPEQQEPKVERLNGVEYQTLEVKRITLFPQNTGNISIEPMELSANVYLGFEPFEYKFKSNAIALTVKPLPEKNKPNTFNGAVGKFSFNAEYDKTKVNVDEPISLKITYKGTGNLKLITAPKLEFPDEFEAYEPKAKDDYKNNGNEVTGVKSFEYILIPQDGGTFKLPKYEFAYFDVDKQDYVKFILPETTITVSGNAKISVNVANFFKREKKDKPRSIYGIKQQYLQHKNFVRSNTFWGLIAMPTLIIILSFIFRTRDYSDTELLLMRRKKANAIALKRMSMAKKLLYQKNEQGFYNEVIRALWHYLSDKLVIPQSELSKENIADRLQFRNVQHSKIVDVKTTLNTCKQALFTPIRKKITMQQTYEKAIELIVDLEDELKKKKK
mgnify:CR=1 FL=1